MSMILRMITATALFLVGCATTDIAEPPNAYGLRSAALTSGPSVPLTACDLASTMTIAVPAQCPTIQAAINHAKGGATITIAAGTYTESVVLDRVVTLQGAGSGSTKIKAASSTATALTLKGGAGGTLTKLSLTYGKFGVAAGVPDTTGKVVLPGNLTLTDVAINGTGTGISGSYVSLFLNTVQVTNCSVAGTAIAQVAVLKVDKSTFTNNLGDGLGVAVVGSATGSVTVTSSTFSNNNGNGLALSGSNLSLTCSGSIFNSNWTSGVALSNLNGPASITSSTASLNAVAGMRAAFGTGDVAVKNCSFNGNVNDALAIYNGDHKVDFWNDTITNNGRVGINIFQNGSKPVTVDTCTLNNIGNVGIAVAGWSSKVVLNAVSVVGATTAGVELRYTGPTTVTGAWLANTKADSAGKFGDGIVDIGSLLYFVGSFSYGNTRSGVTLFGCNPSGGSLGATLYAINDRIDCNGFPLDVESSTGDATLACPAGSSGPGTTDDGNNLCGTVCPSTKADMAAASFTRSETVCGPDAPPDCIAGLVITTYTPGWSACKAQSYQLAPLTPLPIPPPGN